MKHGAEYLTLLKKYGSEVNSRKSPICQRSTWRVTSLQDIIDGTGKISPIKKDDNAVWYQINTQKEILRFKVEKDLLQLTALV